MPEKDSTTGSEYADSVRDVMAHAARSDAMAAHRQEPETRSLVQGPILGVLALVLAAVAYYNVWAFSANAAPEPLPPEQAEVSAGITILVVTQAVEAFREEHGRLPATLEEVGFPNSDLTYRVSGDSYEVTASHGETSVRYVPGQEPLDILEEMGVTVNPGGEGRPGGR